MNDDAQNLPAYPSVVDHPLFGSAQEFYAARLRFLDRLVQDHGDYVRYRIGCDWHHLINDPLKVRDVLRDWQHIDNATSSGEIEFEHSFIAKPGRKRVHQRSISHSSMCPRAVSKIYQRIVATVESSLPRWVDGTRIDLVYEMMCLNVEVISASLFGQESIAWLKPILHALTDLQMVIGAYTRSKETQARISIARRREVFTAVTQIVDNLFDGAYQPPRTSVLGVMSRAVESGEITTQEVVHDLCVLLLAIPTTAAAATYTWLSLSRHPNVRSKLEEALAALPAGPVRQADLQRLTYLDCVLRESMRMYPPIGLILRRVEASWRTGTHEFPSGDFLHISPYLLHRHIDYWHVPERFLPERFDPTSSWYHPEQARAYFPFGFGVRRCIGAELAWEQLRIMVATMARHSRFEVEEGDVAFDVSPVGALYPESLTIYARCSPRVQPLASVG